MHALELMQHVQKVISLVGETEFLFVTIDDAEACFTLYVVNPANDQEMLRDVSVAIPIEEVESSTPADILCRVYQASV